MDVLERAQAQFTFFGILFWGGLLYLFVIRPLMKKANEKSEYRNLVNRIARIARKNHYYAISAPITIGGYHDAIYFHTRGGALERNGTSQSHYDSSALRFQLPKKLYNTEMQWLFDDIKKELGGRFCNNYKSLGYVRSDAPSYITSSFKPGGGTGYQVHTVDEGSHGSDSMLTELILILR